ncbi:hypothetical protein BJX76DRAFT_359799 [Aspergillus varians]
MATVLFFQFVSAAYCVGSTNSIMNNLLRNILTYMPDLNLEDVLNADSSGLQDGFEGDELLGASLSYPKGLQGSWALGIALFGVTFLCALVPKKGDVLLGPLGTETESGRRGRRSGLLLWLRSEMVLLA